jgi:hypothetical protein
VLTLFALPLRAEEVKSLVPGGKTSEVPRDLVDWVPWIRDNVTEGLCPKIGDVERCQWPASLSLEVENSGAKFTFQVFLDAAGWVTLPGSTQHWPEGVEVDGRSAVVLSNDGAPATRLTPGSHRISGQFLWAEAPETLQVPQDLGLVRLAVRGRVIDFPRREENGALWLQAGGAGLAADSERVKLDVFRRIEDGVPLRVKTLLVLQVSGKTRELRLAGALLEGTRPLEIEAAIPARLEDNGELALQVHPGEHRITFTTLYPVPPEQLGIPTHRSPWPELETWVYVPDSAQRQVVVSGAPGIDPAQTMLPEDWRAHQAYLLGAGQNLKFETKRRGEPEPVPNQLALKRDLWLDFDGTGYTVRDVVKGTLSRSFRLDLAGAALGHAIADGKDLLVTRSPDGAYGVELRKPTTELMAEFRYEPRGSTLPAVGWRFDVTSLATTLNLPPGWDLLHVSGADSVHQAWTSRWTLWGFFYVLLVTIAVARLIGPLPGALALAALVLTYGAEDAPVVLWGVLLGMLALLRWVPSGWFRQLLRWGGVGLAIGFGLLASSYSVNEIRGAFFPVTRPPWGESGGNAPSFDLGAQEKQVATASLAVKQDSAEEVDRSEPPGAAAAILDDADAAAADAVRQASGSSGIGRGKLSGGKRYAIAKAVKGAEQNLEMQSVDPEAVVQTGPGLPSWRWRQVNLNWTGPVQKDQTLRLFLVSPGWNKIIACLRVLGVALLGLILIRRTPFGKEPPQRGKASSAPPVKVMPISLAVAVGSIAFLSTSLSQAQSLPGTQLLDELKTRLMRPADCEVCLDVELLEFAASGQNLDAVADVHAGTVVSYRLPGPARSWLPRTITVDGRPSSALVLHTDGFLHLRLEPGTHRVKLSGPIAGSELVIVPGDLPHRAAVDADGWTVDGIRDGRIEGSLHFTADERNQSASGAALAERQNSVRHLPPWLEISRIVEIGNTWKITTEVQRKSPVGEPISVRYALLPGEEMTEATALVEQGQVVITLGRDDTTQTYTSVLKPSDVLKLVAAKERPWNEDWKIRCLALHHCEFEGIFPYNRVDELGYSPRFRPWPGETLVVRVTKPPAAAGASRTIERANLVLTPGQRLLAGRLDFAAKVSKGAPLVVKLEPGASVQSLKLNGKEEPIRAMGSSVEISLPPGRQEVSLAWHENQPLSFWFRAPKVELGERAVNASVEIHMPEQRWLLFTMGPTWGPKILLWSYLLLLVGAAYVLVRIPYSPLKTWQWAILGLGLTQVPLALAGFVAGWFFLLAYRNVAVVVRPWLKKLFQVAVAVYTLAFLGCLCGAVYDGLVTNPDMHIATVDMGSNMGLRWFEDRIQGAMPRPIVLSLPVLVFRLLNLLWALWLASSLLGWLKWGWQCFAQGGLWAKSVSSRLPDAPAGTDSV